MEGIFEVSKEKREAVIKKKQKQLGIKYTVGKVLYSIFKKVPLALLPVCLVLILFQDVDFEEKFLVALVAIAYTAISYYVGIVIQLIWDKKFLYLWTYNSMEVIRVYNKSFEYGYYSKANSGIYNVKQIKYKDVVRMEYIEKDFCLKVYGSCKVQRWSSYNRERLVNEEIYTDDENWFVFLEYFDKFEQICNILEERTGKKIVKISDL